MPSQRLARVASHTGGVQAGDAGAGLLSSVVGVLVFLTLLLFAVQLVFALYATSTVTAAAWDAARIAAGSGSGTQASARLEAEQHLRGILGDYGDRLEIEWRDHPNDVVLTVRADHPTFIPGPLRRSMGLDRIDRTVRVRHERVR